MAAAQESALTARPTARPRTSSLVLLVALAVAGFGAAFVVAHSNSRRTVKDPPRTVTVVAPAKQVGTAVAIVRPSATRNLQQLVETGEISDLAPLPTYRYKPPVQTTPSGANPDGGITVH